MRRLLRRALGLALRPLAYVAWTLIARLLAEDPSPYDDDLD